MAATLTPRGPGRPRHLADRICPACQRSFRPRERTIRFCSRACSQPGQARQRRIGASGPPYSLTQAAALLGCDPATVLRHRRVLGLGTWVPGGERGHWALSAADLSRLAAEIRPRRRVETAPPDQAET